MNSIPRERLDEIVEEVMALMGAEDVFEFLDSSAGYYAALEQLLQNVMHQRHRYESIELAMYLRTSYSRQSFLPSWRPLLNASIEMAVMRREPVKDIFYGMISNAPHPQRNTGQPITQKR